MQRARPVSSRSRSRIAPVGQVHRQVWAARRGLHATHRACLRGVRARARDRSRRLRAVRRRRAERAGRPYERAGDRDRAQPAAVGERTLLHEPACRGLRGHWSPSNDRYSSAYVRPTGWAVDLDGCGSRGGSDPRGRLLAITSFEWRLEPLDGQANPVTVISGSCRNTRARVGGLGRWRVELTVRSANGRAARADIGTRRLRDVVVVAFGDSYVSGEGNPDSNAVYEGGFLVERPRWTDKQCHRSRASWAMRAAHRVRGLEHQRHVP